MFKIFRGIALVAAIILNCGAAFGQTDDFTANARMPGCRALLRNNDLILKEFSDAMNCAGLVGGIIYGASVGRFVCYEPNMTIGQMVRVVVKYIDDRPARQHEDFRALAFEALRAALPCKN